MTTCGHEPHYAKGLCRDCYRRQWRVDNPESASRHNRKYLYGITEEQRLELLKQQNNCCAICKTETKLVVDHIKGTKTVRGLLCSNCNTGIGLLQHDIDVLTAAMIYLAKGERQCESDKLPITMD